MKKLILFFVLLFCITVSIQAQTRFSIESQNLLQEKEITPTALAFMSHNFNQKLGVFAWYFVNKFWSEAYVGPTYSPKPYIQLGIGYGLEQSEKPWRVGGFIWLGNKKYQSLTLLETGNSGNWFRSTFNINLNQFFGIGGIYEKFLGIGPRVEINISKTPIQIWLAGLHKEKWSEYLSIKLNF